MRLDTEEARIYLDDPTAIIVDTGKVYDPTLHNFDHHQDFIVDDDGYPVASAGLVWSHYGRQCLRSHYGTPAFMLERVYNRLARTFIRALDAYDADHTFSAQATCSAGPISMPTLPELIGQMNFYDIGDSYQQDRRFRKALKVAYTHLTYAVQNAERIESDSLRFDAVATPELDGRLIVFSKYVTWQATVLERYPDALFVAYPSPRAETPWSLQVVPEQPGSRAFRGGHPGIVDAPGLDTPFIHLGKFIAGCRTLDELRALAQHNIQP